MWRDEFSVFDFRGINLNRMGRGEGHPGISVYGRTCLLNAYRSRKETETRQPFLKGGLTGNTLSTDSFPRYSSQNYCKSQSIFSFAGVEPWCIRPRLLRVPGKVWKRLFDKRRILVGLSCLHSRSLGSSELFSVLIDIVNCLP